VTTTTMTDSRCNVLRFLEAIDPAGPYRHVPNLPILHVRPVFKFRQKMPACGGKHGSPTRAVFTAARHALPVFTGRVHG